jgi:hypothetical protein
MNSAFYNKLILFGVIARLEGRSSIHDRWLLDRPVNPPIKSGEGDDSTEVKSP